MQHRKGHNKAPEHAVVPSARDCREMVKQQKKETRKGTMRESIPREAQRKEKKKKEKERERERERERKREREKERKCLSARSKLTPSRGSHTELRVMGSNT